MAANALAALHTVHESVDTYSRVPGARHPGAAKLIAYWRDVIQRDGVFAIGRHIPARPIAALLQNIVISEPSQDGADMRIRLAGNFARRRFGGDISGAHLSDLFPAGDFCHHLEASFEAIATGSPMVFDSCLKRGQVVELHSEVVLLPIADRDGISPLVLVGMFSFDN
ncbi:MAG: PAS domain-containing protein [Proteobacteria bacterium]|nr:PAS domain-containing protein [Pseudomonadota bacterium]